MDGFISVFNGHINDADKRARAALTEIELETIRSIEIAGDGIMAIFDWGNRNAATMRYVGLVKQFVNE